MLTLGRYRVAIEAVLVFLALWLLVAYCTPKAPDAELERVQTERVKVALAYRHQRLATDSVARVNVSRETQLRSTTMLLRKRTDSLTARLAGYDSVLADTNVSRDALHSALGDATERLKDYAQQVTMYADSVDALLVAWGRERASYQASLALADSVIQADSVMIRVLTERNRCTILGMKCPSRPQSFVAGVLLTLTMVVM